MNRETKQVSFEIRAINEDGTFEGLASTYGNVDQGKDVIEKGAFTKTLAEHDHEIVLLWQHDPSEPIGAGTLTDTDDGLELKGRLELDLETAKKAYVSMKAKLVKGLSIGFAAIKKETKNGIRVLKEIKLYEVSVVTFPMNEQAMVTAVKAAFSEELERRKTAAAVWQAVYAMESALDSAIWDRDMDAEAKVARISADVDGFKAALLEAVPAYLDLYGLKAEAAEQSKADEIDGKLRQRIEHEIEELQALLPVAAVEGTSQIGEAAGGTIEGAAESDPEPVADANHSDINGFAKSVIAMMRAA